ncbi:hypothetical protein NOCA2670019 [metagenome]|uniref:Uncharacterized protein n=1 Tax=metagenome TaxID=256318 RepID=A0A2P2CCP9_9ZZZZ
MGLVADQRGRELDDGVASVVCPAVEAFVVERLGQEAAQQLLGLGVVEGLLGRLVLDELDAVEVAGSADVADDRQVVEPLEGGTEPVLVGTHVLEDVLLLEHVEVGQRHRGGDRVTAPGVAVHEGVVALEERLHQPVGGDHGAQRGVARGDALGAGDDVGLVAVALGGEHVTETAEGADDLVADQEDVVLVADLTDPLEVAGRRRETAAGVLHGLEEDRSDRVGAFELDGLGDPVGRPQAEGLFVVLVDRGAVEVGVRHPEGRGDQGLEGGLHAGDARDRQGPLRGAVVGDGAADDLVLGRLAGELEVLLRELPGRLDGLSAPGGEEDSVEVAGGVVGDSLGQLDGARVGVGPERVEGHRGGLLGGGLRELGAAVAQLVDEQPTETVQVALAVGVVDVGTLTADDDRHIRGVVGRVAGEVHPQVILGGLLQVVVVGVLIHTSIVTPQAVFGK